MKQSIASQVEAELKNTPAYQYPEARRAIDEALLKIQKAETSGNRGEVNRLLDALNEELKSILETIALSPLPEEPRAWLEALVENQYDEALATVNIVLDRKKGEVAPAKEKVKASILRTLTAEQVAEIRKLREPTLLIIPDTTAERFETAVKSPACKTMPEQKDAWFDEKNFYKNAVNAIAASRGATPGQPITSFRFAIVEGKQHFDAQNADPDFAWNKPEKMTNEDRITAFKRYLASHPGLKSADAAIFMMLMIRGLRKREPTDSIFDTSWQFTLLPGEPENAHMNDRLVALGFWVSDYRQAGFGDSNLRDADARGRLRAAVIGDIS